MFRRFFAFRTRHQPYMVRFSYRHEMRSALTFPLAASLAEGSFTGVVAAKNFDASIVLMSVIAAAPMFGNITALIWAQVSLGRRKVPLVNALQLGVVLMIASVALTSLLPTHLAGWVFAAQIIVARLLASGIVTVRSTIWRANYPRSVRGQIISRISVVATAVLAATTFAGSYLLDRDRTAYVYLYPTAALLGAIGIWQFSRIRVRREVLLRRREEQLYTIRPEEMSQTDETNVMNYQPAARPHGLDLFRQAWQVLREDREFRIYQRWQMISGFSFMMTVPAVLYMVSKEMTNPRQQYLLATIVVQIVPLLTVLLFTQLWAPLFDRVHVTVFRVAQMGVGVAGLATLFAAGMYGSDAFALAIVVAAQVLIGISHAGGNLAWNLGHNDFAPAAKASTYMGVHVMLTGLRGCIAPFVGSMLFKMPWVERKVFGIAAALAMIAVMGFLSMARRAPPQKHRTTSPPRLVRSKG